MGEERRKMETTLSVQKSSELIKLGIEPEFATGSCSDGPVFRLSDLMGLLPQWIMWNDEPLWLNIWVKGTDWWVAYLSIDGVDEAYTSVLAYEQVDALYEALRCLLSHGLIRV